MRVAIYARFSTEGQREASLDDQTRNCERHADREGWHVVTRFADRALSGTKRDRPGYQAMLAAAKRREFDVLVVDDLSRLSRDEIELKQTVRRFRFAGLRIVSVSDGFDSAAKGHKIQATVRGLLNEIYLDDLAEKTHRGLTGQALKGFNAGGRSYGYRHLPIVDASQSDEYGRPRVIAARREINQEQARIVRLIFSEFADGRSPRAIAIKLNQRGISSPRGGTWALSAIYGDRRTGVGILNNPLYIGRVIWNRSRWERNPDTGRRRRVERPEAEWIVREDESLRIVSPELWDRAQARIKRSQHRPGPRARYLFSGILRCGVCGGPFVKVDGYRYGCATHKDRGPAVCGNGMTVAVKIADRALLDDIRQRKTLLSDEAVALFRRETAILLRAEKHNRGDGDGGGESARLAALEREIANMVAAIKAGAFSDSLRTALAAAEAERAALQEHAKADKAMATLPDFLPRAADVFRGLMADLETVLVDDSEVAREHLRALLGEEIQLVPRPEDRALEARIPQGGVYRLALKMAAGAELDNVGSGGRIWSYLPVLLPASGTVK